MKIMIVTPYLPHSRVGHGGGMAVRDLVRTLAARHEVKLVSLLRPGESGHVPDVAALGAAVSTLPYRDASARGAARLGLLGERAAAWLRTRRSGYPLYVEKYGAAALVEGVRREAAAFAPDAVQFEFLQTALLCRGLDAWRRSTAAGGPRLVLNSHELGSLPRERRAAAARNGRERRRATAEAAAWRRLQVDATAWADHTLCVTPQDHALYAAMGGRKLVTVPLGVDTDAIVPVWAPTPDGPEEYLFVGSFGHRPNRLAARLLVREIWPAVRARRPGARLLLAGRGSRRFLSGLGVAPDGDAAGVTAVGFVDDLTDLYRRARLFVAPLPEGGGIKIKILEAMARGIPVVTTAVGAEGITDTCPDAVIQAPAHAAFAAAVIAAADDPAGCGFRAVRARRLIEEEFSWRAIGERLTALYGGT